MSLNINDVEASPNNENVYQGRNQVDYNSLITACALDENSEEFFTIKDAKKSSILVKSENVASMLQYGMDKILVHISERDLLIINDW